MQLGTMLVRTPVRLFDPTYTSAGHPEPAPHLVNEEPAKTGKRRGLLSAYPRTNDHENWLRGAWPTDKNGVVQFTSKVFPPPLQTTANTVL